MNISHLIQQVTILAFPLLLSITLHEVAHGWMANRYGDPTAKSLGRVTLNPLAHIDIFGTIILPVLLLNMGIFFGYAKPVPVNFSNLRNPRRHMIWVAGAGPGTNIILAMASALLFRMAPIFDSFGTAFAAAVTQPVEAMLVASVRLNILLAAINLIPVPPTDGGRILMGILPREHALALSKVEPLGMLILIIIIFFDPLRIFSQFIWPAVQGLSFFFLGG